MGRKKKLSLPTERAAIKGPQTIEKTSLLAAAQSAVADEDEVSTKNVRLDLRNKDCQEFSNQN